MRSITDRASSATTSRRRGADRGPQRLARGRVPSFSALARRRSRRARAPGRTGFRTPTDTANVKSSTWPSIAISPSRGTLAAPSARMPARLRNASRIPSAPPPSASRTLSVRSCRTSRPRPAPSATPHRHLAAAARARATGAGSPRWRTQSAARTPTAPISMASAATNVADHLLVQRHDAERQTAVGRDRRPGGHGAGAP